MKNFDKAIGNSNDSGDPWKHISSEGVYTLKGFE